MVNRKHRQSTHLVTRQTHTHTRHTRNTRQKNKSRCRLRTHLHTISDHSGRSNQQPPLQVCQARWAAQSERSLRQCCSVWTNVYSFLEPQYNTIQYNTLGYFGVWVFCVRWNFLWNLCREFIQYTYMHTYTHMDIYLISIYSAYLYLYMYTHEFIFTIYR